MTILSNQYEDLMKIKFVSTRLPHSITKTTRLQSSYIFLM